MKIPAVYWLSSSAVAVIGGIVMAAGFFQMQNQNGISQTFEETGVVSIRTELTRSAVQLASSEQAETVTVELKNVPSTVKVFTKDGTLWVTDAGWSNLHFFSFGPMNDQIGEVVITVPQEEYEVIRLSAGFGSKNSVYSIQTENMTIDVDAGEWILEQAETDKLIINSGAGEISMNSVHVMQRAEMDIGAGNIEMKDCTFDTLAYSQGAGNLTGSGITVQGMANIESGAGNCTLDVCQFAGDTTFDFGMGDLELNDLRLSGDMDISCGAGNVTIGILGKARDYTVDCSDHVGNTSIQGKYGTAYMDGNKYRITIDGVGNADVSFHE